MTKKKENKMGTLEICTRLLIKPQLSVLLHVDKISQPKLIRNMVNKREIEAGMTEIVGIDR